MIEQRVFELKSEFEFWQKTGRDLPQFFQCVHENGKPDYEMLSALLLVNPLLLDFKVRYDEKRRRLYYEAYDFLHTELQKEDVNAICIIMCGLKPKFFDLASRNFDEKTRSFLKSYYDRYKIARDYARGVVVQGSV